MKLLPFALAVLVLLPACAETYNPLENYNKVTPASRLALPTPASAASFSPAQVEQGKYMVSLLGCSSCHTNGALVGRPDMEQILAGSDTGIAWSNPMVEPNPGVVYPANITPDMETGIGAWSADEIVRMVRTGVDKHSGQTLPVMPWPSYAMIKPDDAQAIAAYLLSLPPVSHKVPANIRKGQRATAPFVHLGVYQSKDQTAGQR